MQGKEQVNPRRGSRPGPPVHQPGGFSGAPHSHPEPVFPLRLFLPHVFSSAERNDFSLGHWKTHGLGLNPNDTQSEGARASTAPPESGREHRASLGLAWPVPVWRGCSRIRVGAVKLGLTLVQALCPSSLILGRRPHPRLSICQFC